MFAGKGRRRGRTPVPLRLERAAGEAPLNRIRFADSLRRNPARRPTSTARSGGRRLDLHVEDMELLYAGFDLCDPATSVSMTINGRRPLFLPSS